VIRITSKGQSLFSSLKNLNNQSIYCFTNLPGTRVVHRHGLMEACKQQLYTSHLGSQLLLIESFQIWPFWNILNSPKALFQVWMPFGSITITKIIHCLSYTINSKMSRCSQSIFGGIMVIRCQCQEGKTFSSLKVLISSKNGMILLMNSMGRTK